MRAAEAPAAIGDGELASLFAFLAPASKIALAVSGGADSLALLDCVDRWRRQRGSPGVVVLSVDHRLRPEAAAEAAAVAALAARRGLPCRILVFDGPHTDTGIEAAARTARYTLLLAAAREEGATHLVTAHHRDDQAETFLMRLVQGSGPYGLAAMRRAVTIGEPGQTPVVIARPFLGISRERLAATAEAAGLVPAIDPMNSDRRFFRARIRGAMPRLAAAGIDAADLAAAAARMAEAADALDQWTTRLANEAVAVDDLAVAWLDAATFAAAPEEARRHLVVRLLLAIGGGAYPPRGENLDGLLAALSKDLPLKRTLAGVVVERRRGKFAFYREIGREGIPAIQVSPGWTGLFDHRFRVALRPDAPPDLSLSALGEAGRREIGALADRGPIGALAALPAFRRGGRLLAVPPLSWPPGAAPIATVAPVVAERMTRSREPA